VAEMREIRVDDALEELTWACREQYVREMDRYAKLARVVAEKCREVVKENAIRAYVTYRAKDPDRLREKLERIALRDGEGRLRPGRSPSEILGEIRDLAGARIVLYQQEDRDRIEALIRPLFVQWNGLRVCAPAGENAGGHAEEPPVRKRKDDDPATTRYYRADHYNLALRPEDTKGDNFNLAGLACELQVTTLFAHAFSEIEHDLRYKTLSGSPSRIEDHLLDLLGQHALVGDELITNLIMATECRQIAYNGLLDDVYNFVIVMKHKFRNKDFGRHASPLYELLKRLRLDSMAKLEDVLLQPGFEERSARLLEDFRAYCERKGYGDSIPDRNSSDVLLMLVLDRYEGESPKEGLLGKGLGVPSRIRRMAERYRGYLEESGSAGEASGQAVA